MCACCAAFAVGVPVRVWLLVFLILNQFVTGTGVSVTESSIYAAYLDVIKRSEHFIYIENQFFISSLAGSDVQNTIAAALVERIVLAMAKKEIFRVIVVLPVTPEGKLVFFCFSLLSLSLVQKR